MGWELTPFSVPLALVSVALLALAVALARAARRETDTGAYLVVSLIAGTALWVFLSTLQVSQTGLAASVFLAKLEFGALAALPPIWLAYVVWYTGRERWLSPRLFGPLFGLGLLLVLGVATNEAHLLFWERIRLLEGPAFAFDAEYGPLFAAYVAYLYCTMAAATVLLVGTVVGTRGVLRAQSASLLAFSLAPTLAGGASAMGYSVVPGLNLAALATVVTALAGAVSLFRFRWLELQPITRDHVLSVLAEPTLVVDGDGCVLDHNPRAAELFTGDHGGDFVGRRLDEIAPQLGTILSTRLPHRGTETTLATAEGRKRFEVTITSTAGRNGAVFLLHDVTDRVEAQTDLAEGRATMEQLVRVARDLSAATEAKTVHERTVHATCNLVDADHCRLVSPEDGSTLAATGETTRFDDALSTTIAERVADAGQSHVVADLTIRGATVGTTPTGTRSEDAPRTSGPAPTPDAPSADASADASAGEAAVGDDSAADFGFGGADAVDTDDVAGAGDGADTGDGVTTGDGADTGDGVATARDAVDAGSAATSAPEAAGMDGEPSDLILEETFGSLVSVPVEGVGVLQAFHRDVDEFDEGDVETLTLLAAHVVTASDRVETEAELRQERDRLEEFASVVSHDLRNPLSVATGFVELAREEPADDHFDRIERALDQMDDLIDDLLRLARHGESIGETERVDLQTVVRDAWGMVETGDATLRLDGELGTADVDRARAVELFSNLFRNSVEHGADGTDGAVTVRVARTADRISVADDGPGIPVDLRDQVLNRGVSTSDSGTGFGLAIVDEIADAHGWAVEVDESENGGAKFDVVGIE